MRLEVFVPGRISNPLNGSHQHPMVHAKWARTWRSRTAERMRIAGWTGSVRPNPATPKRVTFLARVWNCLDDDNLPAALKPCRDGLVDAGALDSDGPRAGHEFVYFQVIDRKRRGVEITVEDKP